MTTCSCHVPDMIYAFLELIFSQGYEPTAQMATDTCSLEDNGRDGSLANRQGPGGVKALSPIPC